MLEIKENVLDADTYLRLRAQVGWIRLSDAQARAALRNALYTLCAYLDGEPVGMGRIVGDGAVVSYIQDLVVVPKAQGMNIGGLMLEKLRAYAESLTEPNTRMMLCLMCAKGRENFYESHGFTARPTDALGPGMICYIDK
ncbi:MAG: GNAT family N-acetyltransferase [Butyrivibrio sp.]|nr:GNAT family N-acetyltransferase [Butyrivibrio sp.]